MILTFLVAFVFSFIGSIPPGSLNISVIQLGLQNRIKIVLRFALAAALVEFPYAYIAVKFQDLITSSPLIVNNFQLIAASVMIALGVINIVTSRNPSQLFKKLEYSGFRKGVILSILNPLAIPFWIGVTAYLNNMGWISINSEAGILIYVSGVSIGTFTLLLVFGLLSSSISHLFRHDRYIRLVPGFVFIALGIYALIEYLSLI